MTRTWIKLSPNMLGALADLAETDGVAEVLITSLINEALAYRLLEISNPINCDPATQSRS